MAVRTSFMCPRSIVNQSAEYILFIRQMVMFRACRDDYDYAPIMPLMEIRLKWRAFLRLFALLTRKSFMGCEMRQ